METNELKFKLPIQFFNDEGNSEGANPTGGANEPTGGNADDPKSFDDLLNDNKDYQSEYDKRISKALETHSTKLNEEFDKKLKKVLE